MATKAFVTIKDYDGETSTTSFWVQDIGAVNYAAVTQDIDEVKDSIITVSRGNVLQSGFTKTFPENPAPVTDAEAQREEKWLCSFRDTTQFLDAGNTIANPGYLKIFTMEIGAAKLSVAGTPWVTTDGSADRSITAIDDFFTDVPANVRSPYNHTAGVTPTSVLVSMVHVGRNT